MPTLIHQPPASKQLKRSPPAAPPETAARLAGLQPRTFSHHDAPSGEQPRSQGPFFTRKMVGKTAFFTAPPRFNNLLEPKKRELFSTPIRHCSMNQPTVQTLGPHTAETIPSARAALELRGVLAGAMNSLDQNLTVFCRRPKPPKTSLCRITPLRCMGQGGHCTVEVMLSYPSHMPCPNHIPAAFQRKNQNSPLGWDAKTSWRNWRPKHGKFPQSLVKQVQALRSHLCSKRRAPGEAQQIAGFVPRLGLLGFFVQKNRDPLLFVLSRFSFSPTSGSLSLHLLVGWSTLAKASLAG